MENCVQVVFGLFNFVESAALRPILYYFREFHQARHTPHI